MCSPVSDPCLVRGYGFTDKDFMKRNGLDLGRPAYEFRPFPRGVLPAPLPSLAPAATSNQRAKVRSLKTVAIADSYSTTQKNVVKLEHIWTIRNFTFFLSEGFILSPPFTADADDEIFWCLGLCPRGCDEDSKDYISLALCLRSSKKGDVLVKYKFSIMKTQGEAVVLDSMDEPVKLSQGGNWGSKKLIRRDQLTEYNLLRDDELSVYCELWYATETQRFLAKEPFYER